MTENEKNTIKQLFAFIQQSPSPFHTVAALRKELEAAGFTELYMDELWELEQGGRYFTNVYGSTLLAFTVGEQGPLRLAAAHTDFPGLRIKPEPELAADSGSRLNIEPYGGLLRAPWLDRPLSLAGRVALAGEDAFHPVVRLVDFQRPVGIIPNLAIHMNRAANDGVKLSPQKEMPLLVLCPEQQEAQGGSDAAAERDNGSFFRERLAEQLDCDVEDILSWELNVYPVEQGCMLGFDASLASAPRLDNLTSVYACLQGIKASPAREGVQLAAFFDNEEVGSRTKQGAGSTVLLTVLRRIYRACGWSEEQLDCDIAQGFMLSVDVGHAEHPAHVDKSDPTNHVYLGSGLVIKQASSQSYAGDAEAVAVVRSLCQEHGIPCQIFVNHSDQRGGSTLGSIASAIVPIRTMDVGVPLLAMHSVRETMGTADQQALDDLLCVYFSGTKESMTGDEA